MSGSRYEGTRARVAAIIFGHDTPAGKAFDVALIVVILASVAAVMLETVAAVQAEHRETLRALEWAITGLFTLEYALRLWSAPRRWAYAKSFFGVVDLLSIIPTYLSVLVPGGQAFATVRALRLLRVFRVLKLGAYLSEAGVIATALRESRRKITVFLLTVLTLVVILGSVMYVVEGPASGFTSIPRSIYWAVVTLTTVGYGDIAPRSSLGQGIAMIVMVIGYGIIAVPTGIVTVELGNAARRGPGMEGACRRCGALGHVGDARFCRVCGSRLRTPRAPRAVAPAGS